MNVTELVPVVNCRVRFSLRYRKFVPNDAGCYALAAFNGDVLYVGLTDNLCRRFAQHRDSKVKRSETPRGGAFWFYYLTCGVKQTYCIERTWINQHVEFHGAFPVLNGINSPVH